MSRHSEPGDGNKANLYHAMPKCTGRCVPPWLFPYPCRDRIARCLLRRWRCRAFLMFDRTASLLMRCSSRRAAVPCRLIVGFPPIASLYTFEDLAYPFFLLQGAGHSSFPPKVQRYHPSDEHPRQRHQMFRMSNRNLRLLKNYRETEGPVGLYFPYMT